MKHLKRPNDEFFQPKIKILSSRMETYIADLEIQRRCPYQSIKCVYRDGYNCADHTICPGNGDAYCYKLTKLKDICSDVLQLIGNVDHSIGNGPNSAKTRGELLNDVRKILTEYMPKELEDKGNDII